MGRAVFLAISRIAKLHGRGGHRHGVVPQHGVRQARSRTALPHTVYSQFVVAHTVCDDATPAHSPGGSQVTNAVHKKCEHALGLRACRSTECSIQDTVATQHRVPHRQTVCFTAEARPPRCCFHAARPAAPCSNKASSPKQEEQQRLSWVAPAVFRGAACARQAAHGLAPRLHHQTI